MPARAPPSPPETLPQPSPRPRPARFTAPPTSQPLPAIRYPPTRSKEKKKKQPKKKERRPDQSSSAPRKSWHSALSAHPAMTESDECTLRKTEADGEPRTQEETDEYDRDLAASSAVFDAEEQELREESVQESEQLEKGELSYELDEWEREILGFPRRSTSSLVDQPTSSAPMPHPPSREGRTSEPSLAPDHQSLVDPAPSAPGHLAHEVPSDGITGDNDDVELSYTLESFADEERDSASDFGRLSLLREFVDWYCEREDLRAACYGMWKSAENSMTRVIIRAGDLILGEGAGETRRLAKTAALENFRAAVDVDIWSRFQQERLRTRIEPVRLANGDMLDIEAAVQLIRFYVREYRLEDAVRSTGRYGISDRTRATVSIEGLEVGSATGQNLGRALSQALLNAAVNIVSRVPDLWTRFLDFNAARRTYTLRAKTGVYWLPSTALQSRIATLSQRLAKSELAQEAERVERRHRQHISNRERRLEPFYPSLSSPISLSPLQPLPREAMDDRSRFLFTQLDRRSKSESLRPQQQARLALPIMQDTTKLLRTIEENVVTIIVAETGSGKTTQVPQLVFDQWAQAGHGSECNIVVSQPRRIAAVSIAQRVAEERGEAIGQSIGYIVKHEQIRPIDDGQVLFTTVGTCLRSINASWELLEKCTHLIIDEVHGREAMTDLLLCLVKRMIAVRASSGLPAIRVVLMSATIDPQVFADYFKDPLTALPAPIIRVPGRTFPVERHSLGALVPRLRSRYPSSTAWDVERVKHYLRLEGSPTSEHAYAGMPFELLALAVDDSLRESQDGHCLVFVAGLSDIRNLRAILLDPQTGRGLGILDYSDTTRYEVIVMHSSVPLSDQQIIFRPPASGVRRIIITTDICETSITIPDVTTVVDGGRIKDVTYDVDLQSNDLQGMWAARANLEQRAGRAGRHRSGTYYSLVSEQRLAMLPETQVVAIDKADLSELILVLKGLGLPVDAGHILAACLNPPSPARIDAAIAVLKRNGSLDDGGELTGLGGILCYLGISYTAGIPALYGLFLRCLGHGITIGLLSKSQPFTNPPMQLGEAKAAKDAWSPPSLSSDPLASVAAFDCWLHLERGSSEAHEFCTENYLSDLVFWLMAKERGELISRLNTLGAADVDGRKEVADEDLKTEWKETLDHGSQSATTLERFDVHRHSVAMMGALLAVAGRPFFAVRTSRSPGGYRFETGAETQAHVSPRSINAVMRTRELTGDDKVVDARPMTPLSTELLTFQDVQRTMSADSDDPYVSSNASLRVTSRIDVLTYFLFGAQRIERINRPHDRAPYALADGWLPIIGKDGDGFEHIIKLREQLSKVFYRVFEGVARRAYRTGQIDPSMASGSDDLAMTREGAQRMLQDRTSLDLRPLSLAEAEELAVLAHDLNEVLTMAMDERVERERKGQARSLHDPLLGGTTVDVEEEDDDVYC